MGLSPAQGVVVSALLRAVLFVVVFPLGLAFGGWRLVAGGAGNEVDQIEKDDESEEIEETDQIVKLMKSKKSRKSKRRMALNVEG
jgi:hypothetical protein